MKGPGLRTQVEGEKMVEACIICHEFKTGTPVEDTLMLRSLRKLKADFPPIQLVWGKPTGNTLVVCPECADKYAKRRKGYEGKVLLHALLSAALLVFIVVLPLVSGTFTLGSIVVGVLLTAMLMALPLLDYVPPVSKEGMEQLKEQTTGGQTQTKETQNTTAATSPSPIGPASLGAPTRPSLYPTTPVQTPTYPIAPAQTRPTSHSKTRPKTTTHKSSKSKTTARRRR